MKAAREAQETCVGNLSQLARAFGMYVADYSGMAPADPARFADSLSPYLMGGVPPCPADARDGGPSYALNARLGAGWSPAYETTPVRLVLMYDADARGQVAERHPARALGDGSRSGGADEDGANYAFCDGHVAWRPDPRGPDLSWEPSASPPSPRPEPGAPRSLDEAVAVAKQLKQDGRTDAAIALLIKAIDDFEEGLPTHAEAEWTLAWLYYAKGETDNALPHFKAVTYLEPEGTERSRKAFEMIEKCQR